MLIVGIETDNATFASVGQRDWFTSCDWSWLSVILVDTSPSLLCISIDWLAVICLPSCDEINSQDKNATKNNHVTTISPLVIDLVQDRVAINGNCCAKLCLFSFNIVFNDFSVIMQKLEISSLWNYSELRSKYLKYGSSCRPSTWPLHCISLFK